MKRTIVLTATLLFVAVFIGIVVLADRGEGNQWWPFINDIPAGDKVGHLGLIGTLSLLCNLAFHPRQPVWLPRWISLVTLLLLVILSLEEIAQAFLPHRTCDLYDWLADLAGLAFGQIIARRLLPYLLS